MYYGQSTILEKLKLYPSALLLLLVSISGLVFFYLRTSQIAVQNKTLDRDGQRTAYQLWHTLILLNGMGFHVKNQG